jgi:Mg-chelatase subunit ChlD
MPNRSSNWVVSVCSLLVACGSSNEEVTLPGTVVDGSTLPGALSDAGVGRATVGATPGDAAGFTGGTTPAVSVGPGASGAGSIPGACEAREVDVYGNAPEMMIVLDRSTSMAMAGRWEPSKQAIKMITHDFDRLIAFGLEVFPGSATDTCGPGMVAVAPKPLNAMAIATAADATQANVPSTPTGAALETAAMALGDRNPQLDQTRARPAFVLLVTDGQPTCTFFQDPEQEMAAITAATHLKMLNIPTYVLGYQIDEAARPVMNSIAMAGGTQHYYPAESAADIQMAFREITKDVVRCEFELNEQADTTRVDVTLDGKSISLDPADGWEINGRTVTLKGQSCATLKDGAAHPVSVQVACEPLR